MKLHQLLQYTMFVCCLTWVVSNEHKTGRINNNSAQSRRRLRRHGSKSYHDHLTENAVQQNIRRAAEWMSYPRIAPKPRIVNGNNAPNPDRYPYFVALIDDRERIVCGGSLIAPNVVLSAAHCGFTDLKFAIVGKYYGQIDAQHNEAERIPIVNTYTNPQFTLRDRSHDQLLVQLERPTSSTRPVVRLNLFEGGGDGSLPSLTDRVTVLGLGRTYSSSQATQGPPEVLQQVTMGVVSNAKCQEMYNEYDFFLPSISNDMVCLLADQKGQCNGDSGGPYVLLGDKPEDDVQIGTVAWGIDCANEDYPAVGIRTYLQDDSFVRDTTCSIATNPPSYFGCPTLAPQPVTPTPSTSPTVTRSASPSTAASERPSVANSSAPTIRPSGMPSRSPTIAPTVMASDTPTTTPSRNPSDGPTVMASKVPTTTPSLSPSYSPSSSPSLMDSDGPTITASASPSLVSSEGPSASPSALPTVTQSGVPSASPSASPTVTASGSPTKTPSASPSAMPSTPFPSSAPTTCIVRANSCSVGDTCCGADVCQGGFCRLVPNASKQSGFKDDLKLDPASRSGIRGGSFQAIGIAEADP